jgi:hypothetical protein
MSISRGDLHEPDDLAGRPTVPNKPRDLLVDQKRAASVAYGWMGGVVAGTAVTWPNNRARLSELRPMLA